MAAPGGGASWLLDDGVPDPARPIHTWITARMVHVYALGDLAGLPHSRRLAYAALDGLLGRLRDPKHGGWYSSVGPDGSVDTEKSAYAHAFVVLASASATLAGLPAARELLTDALAVLSDRFWDDSPGMHRDSASADWTAWSAYRGVNANMHAVEALLAAADALGEPRWANRALRITENVLGWARDNQWRIPEHFTPEWQPMLDHHVDEPDHPFEPYGSTVGHGLEWSRLALQVAAATGARGGLAEPASALFARAVEDGWAVDGAEGFVYTVDWEGRPVVRQRMHWVVAEAICAAAALCRATGERAYEEFYRTWWRYAERYLIDDDGSWRHELDPGNGPASSVWTGRPDLYHGVQATLLPRLPLTASLAAALADGMLDGKAAGG